MKTKYFLLFCIVLIPLFLLRDFTPDNELRYLSIADEALHNGTFFTFYNHGMVYADKPPLYLWLVMAGKWLFGTHSMLFLGLFSLIPALVVLAVMYRWTKGAVAENNRVAGMLMLMSTAYFLGSAAVLRMDMLMCMFIVLALHTFYRMYTGSYTWWNRLLFPLWVFLAVFSKGPLGLLIPLVSVPVFLVVKKELKSIGCYWGWVTWSVLLLLCGGWFFMVYKEGGEGYLYNLLFNQTVNRAVDAFHHKRPFYYYLESFWYVVAPWSLLFAGTFFAAIRARIIKTDLERFFLTVSGVTLFLLSLISSKVDVYLLPALPFVVYLGVIWFEKLTEVAYLRWLLAVPVGLIVLAVPVGLLLLHRLGIVLQPVVLVYVAAAVVMAGGVGTFFFLLRDTAVHKAVSLFSITVLLTVFLVSFVLPSVNDRIGYREMCRAGLVMATKQKAEMFYYYNIRRGENMDVYLHQDAYEVDDADLKEAGKLHGVLFCKARDLQNNRLLQSVVAGKVHVNKGEYVIIAL